MCFENPIIHGFRYEGLHVSVLDDGNQFTVEISVGKETYTVEISNTRSDSPIELVSYVRTGISFWLNDLEEGLYEGPLEERENTLLSLWDILCGWTLETHAEDGSYYKKTLAGAGLVHKPGQWVRGDLIGGKMDPDPNISNFPLDN